MARVSVLLPARNAAPTLGAALRSVLGQSYRDLEVVCVDDASVDATAGVLASFRDPRLRVVPGPGKGIAAALEAGRAACSGELVARMDADDVAHPLRLALQVAALDADPRLAAVGSRVALFPAWRVAEGMRRYVAWIHSLHSPADVHRERFVESPLVHPSVTLRAADLERAGGFRESGWPEDHDLWLRLLASGRDLVSLPRVLLFWREHPGRATWTDPRYGKDRHLALRAHHLARGPLAPSRVCALWGAGKTGAALASALGAEGIEVAYFVDVDPSRVGRTRRGVNVIAGDDLPPRGGPLLLLAVAARGARAEIEDFLSTRGWLAGRDYLACI